MNPKNVTLLTQKRCEPSKLKLHCPQCTKQHIDRGEWTTKVHRTHLCEYCGTLWRPSTFPTVGV